MRKVEESKLQRSVSAIYTRLTNSFLSLRVSARTMTLKELDLSDDRLRDNCCVTTNALRKVRDN
jgi:hypothetical protein